MVETRCLVSRLFSVAGTLRSVNCCFDPTSLPSHTVCLCAQKLSELAVTDILGLCSLRCQSLAAANVFTIKGGYNLRCERQWKMFTKNIFNCSLIVEKQGKTFKIKCSYFWLPLWSITAEYVYKKVLLFNRRSPRTTSEELFYLLIFLQQKRTEWVRGNSLDVSWWK